MQQMTYWLFRSSSELQDIWCASFLCIVIPYHKSAQYRCPMLGFFKVMRGYFFSFFFLHIINFPLTSCHRPETVVWLWPGSPPCAPFAPQLAQRTTSAISIYIRTGHNFLLSHPVAAFPPFCSDFLTPSLYPFNKQDKCQPDPVICIRSKFPSPSLSA